MASDTDNSTGDQLPPAPTLKTIAAPKGDNLTPPETHPDGRGMTKWEKKIWRILAREDTMVVLFKELNQTDFILGEMLTSIRDFSEGIEMAKEFAKKATVPVEHREHLELLTKMHKQLMSSLKDLENYRAAHFHQHIKEKRAVKSAMPGQKITLGPPRAMTPTQNGSSQ